MSTPFSESQIARLHQYRQGRRAANSSGADYVAGEEAEENTAADAPEAAAAAGTQRLQQGEPRGVEWNNFFGDADARYRGGGSPPPAGGVGLGSGRQLQQPPSSLLSGKFLGATKPPNSHIAQVAAASASLPTPVAPGRGAADRSTNAPTASGTTGIPTDLANYILDLERQNQELRHHVQFLQDALLHGDPNVVAKLRDAQDGVGGMPQGRWGTNPIGGAGAGGADDDKKAFLNDVLQQIEIVIQAHRNKTAVEMQKYRTEAEQARQALKQLRDSIHQEGLELSMAPAVVLMQKKYMQAVATVTKARGTADGVGTAATGAAGSPQGNGAGSVAEHMSLHVPPHARHLLEAVATDILDRLSTIQEGDDVNALVKDAVEISFEAIVTHFTKQLVQSVRESAHEVDAARAEMTAAKRDLQSQLAVSENQRVALVQRYDLEVQALRDELHAYHVASTQDDVQASVQERALDEYTTMLVEARDEAAKLRRELEEERNHAAQVCLKLKSALQKRNAEFEQAVVEQAEEILKAKHTQVMELQAALAAHGGGPRERVDKQLQAGESQLTVASAQTYVPNVIHAVSAMRQQQHTTSASPSLSVRRGGAPATPVHASAGGAGQSFESDVLRKTQELLGKYSGLSSSFNASSIATTTPVR